MARLPYILYLVLFKMTSFEKTMRKKENICMMLHLSAPRHICPRQCKFANFTCNKGIFRENCRCCLEIKLKETCLHNDKIYNINANQHMKKVHPYKYISQG